MKFPRNARIFRGHLDAAPFASVFFLLVIFVMLGTLVYTPGVQINLPSGDDLPGASGPKVAVDATGRFYFQNQLIGESALTAQLLAMANHSTEPLTLVVLADKETKLENLDRLAAIARNARIYKIVRGTLPRIFDSAPNSPPLAP